jgi:hypothetical protein
MPTAKERILEALEQFGESICDGCLSIAAVVRPSQQVNQICRALAVQGEIERVKGDCGLCKGKKLVNKLNSPIVSAHRSINLIKHPVPDSRGNEPIDAYLERIRHRVIDLLISIDNSPKRYEGISARISRLRDANRLPGYVACMMLTLTGLRNVVVYEKFVPARFELAVVEAAWSSIKEWEQTSKPNS